MNTNGTEPQGEWKEMTDNHGHSSYFCSRCGTQEGKAKKTCPNCGAAMREVKKMNDEKAIEQLEEFLVIDDWSAVYMPYLQDAIEYVINRIKADRWISVKERLPESRDWYLGLFKEPDTDFIGIPYICDYAGEITKGTTHEGWILRNCTDVDNASDYFRNLICVAWQPLPEKYEENEKMNDERLRTQNYSTRKAIMSFIVNTLGVNLGSVKDIHISRQKDGQFKDIRIVFNSSNIAEKTIAEWQSNNPHGRKVDCHRDTGISRPTIDKYWVDTTENENEQED